MHAIRLGTHAEKDYLQRAARWYDEVIVNANLVEATAGATAAFLLTLQKPFMIDPITYAFGQSPFYLMNVKRGEVKRTFRALADRYGEAISLTIAQGQSLPPSHFSDSLAADAFCQNVLEYQRTRLAQALEENEAFLDAGLAEMLPARLVAPYFFNDQTLTWLEVNRLLSEISISSTDGLPLWLAVSLDACLLDQEEERDRIKESYEDLACSGFLLWPSDFDETRASLGQITGLRWLADKLSSRDREVRMLYGGYFSSLLKEEGISGIAHGVGYGEKRDIVPVVGGGLPPAKYYFPAIHDDISIDDLLRLSGLMDEQQFLSKVCSCTICAGLIDRGGLKLLRSEFGAVENRLYGFRYRGVPTARVYRLSRFHYIESKHRELQAIQSKERADLLEELAGAYNDFHDFFGYGRIGYLLTWRQALSGGIPT